MLTQRLGLVDLLHPGLLDHLHVRTMPCSQTPIESGQFAAMTSGQPDQVCVGNLLVPLQMKTGSLKCIGEGQDVRPKTVRPMFNISS